MYWDLKTTEFIAGRLLSPSLRTGARQFFSKHAPQGTLEVRAALALDVLAQGLVDERLVISTASYPITEPLDDVRIEANGDPLLGCLDDCAPLAVGKIVLVTHGSALLVVLTFGSRGAPSREDTDGLIVRLGVDHD